MSFPLHNAFEFSKPVLADRPNFRNKFFLNIMYDFNLSLFLFLRITKRKSIYYSAVQNIMRKRGAMCDRRKNGGKIRRACNTSQKYRKTWFTNSPYAFMFPGHTIYDGWSAWTTWGMCYEPCGKGKQYRYRFCLSLSTSQDKKYKTCQGNGVEHRPCYVKACPGWLLLSTESPCSRTFYLLWPLLTRIRNQSELN